MKSYRAYSDGSYLKKDDVSPPQVWTITDVKEQTVTAPGKEAKDKLVLFFDGTQKGLVLNMANGDALYDMTGHDDPEEWIGERVELFVDDNVNYAGKRVGGVRLRKPTKEPF
jgi:phage baseplate assembly protein gpV